VAHSIPGELDRRSARRLDARASLAIAAGTALIVAVVVPGPMTASLAPRIDRDFAFTDVAVGIVVALFYLASAAGSRPAGRLVERIGPDVSVRIAGGVLAAACLAIAAFADSAAAIAALLLAGSLGHALAGPAVSALLRVEVPARRQGLAFGAQQSGASLAGLAAGLALPALAIPFGWRSAFVAAAALAVAAALLAPRAGPPSARAPHELAHTAEPGSVRALAVVAGLASAAAFGTVSFLVLFCVHSGVDEAAAGLLLAAMGLASTLGRLVFGAVSDRPGRDPLAPVALVIAIGVPGYALLATGAEPAIVAGALLAGGFGWAWSGALTHAVVRRSPRAPAQAVGTMLTGLLLGNAAGPLVIGLLADRGEYTAAWAMCGGLALAAAGLAAAIRARSPREVAA
jgi:predicted MFS family arabinose efflux permease